MIESKLETVVTAFLNNEANVYDICEVVQESDYNTRIARVIHSVVELLNTRASMMYALEDHTDAIAQQINKMR